MKKLLIFTSTLLLSANILAVCVNNQSNYYFFVIVDYDNQVVGIGDHDGFLLENKS